MDVIDIPSVNETTNNGIKDASDGIQFELNMFENEQQITTDKNPLEWWNFRKSSYPLFYPIAIEMLSRPPTSVFIESVFSETGKRERTRGNVSNEYISTLAMFKKNYD